MLLEDSVTYFYNPDGEWRFDEQQDEFDAEGRTAGSILNRRLFGTLFVSDAAGLRYETIDYGKVFADRGEWTFSDSLNSFMRQVQKKHAREGLPKVDR